MDLWKNGEAPGEGGTQSGAGRGAVDASKREESTRSYLPLVLFIVVVSAWAVLRSPIFVDKQPEVAGIHVLNAESVLRLAGLGGPVHLLSVQPDSVEARVEGEPWVEAASVRRIWPSRLLLQVRERVPVARVALRGALFPVDGQGILLTPLQTGAARQLPIITGVRLTEGEVGRKILNESVQSAVEVAGGLEPSFLAQVLEIRVEGGSRVVLHMRGGWVVKLGTSDELKLKLQVLQAVERHARAQGLYLRSIDVRSPLQPVVGTRDRPDSAGS